MNMDPNKQKALDVAIKQIDKAFGKGALVRLGDREIEPIEAISTGSLGLDMALGIGGVPRGRIIDRKTEASAPSSTRNMHSMSDTRKISASMSKICLSASPISANRRSISSRRSHEAVRSTSSSSTPWRR